METRAIRIHLVAATLATGVALGAAGTANAQSAPPPTRTAGYVTIGAGAALVGVGTVFAVLASLQAARLEMFAQASRDPVTGLPLVSYSDVQAVEQQRQLDTGLAIGFFAAGGIGLVSGLVLALLPARSPAERVSVSGGPGGFAVSLRF